MSIVNAESSAVQSHLTILQSVISRMASNSASSKTWCITIVSAILVLVADKSKPELVYLTLIPTLLFWFLDAYYLGLERAFRTSYNNFIEKLHKKEAQIEDTFIVIPSGNAMLGAVKSAYSLSVLPFYFILIVMVCVVKTYI